MRVHGIINRGDIMLLNAIEKYKNNFFKKSQEITRLLSLKCPLKEKSSNSGRKVVVT